MLKVMQFLKILMVKMKNKNNKMINMRQKLKKNEINENYEQVEELTFQKVLFFKILFKTMKVEFLRTSGQNISLFLITHNLNKIKIKMGKLMKKKIHKNLLQFYLLRYKKTEKYLC